MKERYWLLQYYCNSLIHQICVFRYCTVVDFEGINGISDSLLDYIYVKSRLLLGGSWEIKFVDKRDGCPILLEFNFAFFFFVDFLIFWSTYIS